MFDSSFLSSTYISGYIGIIASYALVNTLLYILDEVLLVILLKDVSLSIYIIG